MLRKAISALLFSAALTTHAQAGFITPSSASLVSGSLSGGNTGLIIDGFYQEALHYRGYNGDSVVRSAYWDTGNLALNGAILQVDLGDVYNLEDIVVAVDNNDSYSLTYSVNGTGFSNLFDIANTAGEIGSGIDAFSTVIGNPEYDGLDFSAVNARYIRIFATAGDGRYSVMELQAYGTAISAVPVPATLALFSLGLLSIRLRHRNQQ